MEQIYYNSIDTDSMGLTKEDYKQYCEDNEIEYKEEDEEAFSNWIEDSLDLEWENVEYEIKHYDKEHSGHYYVDANIGRWNGRANAYRVFNSLMEAIYACIGGMAFIAIETMDNGTIEVTGVHHDGTNYFIIKKMSDEGYERYDDWEYDSNGEDFELKDEEVASLIA